MGPHKAVATLGAVSIYLSVHMFACLPVSLSTVYLVYLVFLFNLTYIIFLTVSLSLSPPLSLHTYFFR